MKVVIIDYGAGNVKSVQFAFKRLGVDAILSNVIADIQTADRVVFPGVGEASSAMQMLKKNDLHHYIPTLKQPVLGICLGMQLLCKHTEEGNIEGLGIFDTKIKRFSNTLKVPQIGWNKIKALKSDLFSDISENTYMYLVHSYYAERCSQSIATTHYGFDYASALHNNNFYGVQFHPEKSSVLGEQVLRNFLEIKA